MGSITVTPEDYQDVLIAYLLDLLTNGSPTDNEIFNDLVKRMKGLGLKSVVLNAFLEMDSQSRVKYKMIRNTLMKETNSRSNISVIQSKESKPTEE
jgi:hypothetical protein